jgi:cytochrome b subunit of formate dehydrogenase
MSDRNATRLAWLLCLLCVVGATITLASWLTGPGGQYSLMERVSAIIGWNWGMPVVFSALAALLITRRPRNRVGWLLMSPALALVVDNSLGLSLATQPAELTPGLWLVIWVDSWHWLFIIFPIFLIQLHFPSGRPPSPRWNWVNRLAIGLGLFFMALSAFTETDGPFPNPIGFVPEAVLNGPILIIWGLALVAVAAASVISLFIRYRRSQIVERQQIKWLLYASGILVLVYAVLYFVTTPYNQGSSFASGWANLLLVLSILALPLAITIAILRYQLFDIDVIIRKTAVYAVLSALLALVYFGVIVVLQNVFEAASGQQSPITIVVSTLVIAALFAPLRRRVQDFIDRRFYRRKYDAEKTLAAFAEFVRDETDMEALTAELLRVVGETMQPQRMTIWLKEAKQ